MSAKSVKMPPLAKVILKTVPRSRSWSAQPRRSSDTFPSDRRCPASRPWRRGVAPGLVIPGIYRPRYGNPSAAVAGDPAGGQEAGPDAGPGTCPAAESAADVTHAAVSQRPPGRPAAGRPRRRGQLARAHRRVRGPVATRCAAVTAAGIRPGDCGRRAGAGPDRPDAARACWVAVTSAPAARRTARPAPAATGVRQPSTRRSSSSMVSAPAAMAASGSSDRATSRATSLTEASRI
jgi:hypothetical protein